MAGADKFMVFFDYILHIADNRAQGGEAYPHFPFKDREEN
jgi:hypothetical protein